MKKTLNFIMPYLYLVPFFLVVLHQTDYQPMRLLTFPYVIYVVLAGLGFTFLRGVLKQEAKEENSEK